MSAIALLVRACGAILDAVLPLRSRAARTRELSLEHVPLTYASHELLRTQITTLMDYRDQTVRDLIQSLKYDGSGAAAHVCAGVLAEYLQEELADARRFSQREIILVPMPLHASRERERGFNQIALALRALPSGMRDGAISTLRQDVLARTRPTKPQTHFARSERLSNVAGAFEVEAGIALRKTHAYVIDDVTTTGATLVNAGNALRRAGATVSLVALARA